MPLNISKTEHQSSRLVFLSAGIAPTSLTQISALTLVKCLTLDVFFALFSVHYECLHYTKGAWLIGDQGVAARLTSVVLEAHMLNPAAHLFPRVLKALFRQIQADLVVNGR